MSRLFFITIRAACQDYSGNFEALPDDHQYNRRLNCAMEWWVEQAENEMYDSFASGRSSSSEVQFPIDMRVILEGGRRTYSANYSHSADGELSVRADQIRRRVCAFCEVRFERRLRACTRCLVTYYCSKECQRAHWNVHKQSCVSPSDDIRQRVDRN